MIDEKIGNCEGQDKIRQRQVVMGGWARKEGSSQGQFVS
jgi:hypothetical protein